MKERLIAPRRGYQKPSQHYSKRSRIYMVSCMTVQGDLFLPFQGEEKKNDPTEIRREKKFTINGKRMWDNNKRVTVNNSNEKDTKAMTMLLPVALPEPGRSFPPSPRITDHVEALGKCRTSPCVFLLENHNSGGTAREHVKYSAAVHCLSTPTELLYQSPPWQDRNERNWDGRR